jgi:hypothetical protein
MEVQVGRQRDANFKIIPSRKIVEEEVTMKKSVLSVAVVAASVVFASAVCANVLSNPSFSTGGPASSITGAPVPGPSAAPPWTTWNNSAATTTTRHVPAFKGRTGVIHVKTSGEANGLVQVWKPINTGPSKVMHSAVIYVVSGKVGMGTGNGGNTGVTAFTTGTGQWETIRGVNSVCPANETIIYSTGGPAEFYVDFASVEITSTAPCPTQQGKPDLIVESFGFKGPSAPAPGLCKPGVPVYVFSVRVKNIGSAPSLASAALGNKALVQVMAQDKPGWGNGALLNALAPGASQTVDIPVYYLQANPAFMWTPANVVHPFTAIADPLRLVDESNETNNTRGPINMGKPFGCPPQ